MASKKKLHSTWFSMGEEGEPKLAPLPDGRYQLLDENGKEIAVYGRYNFGDAVLAWAERVATLATATLG